MVNAKQLADRVSGAVIVVNNITRDRTIGTRLHAATESIKLRLRELLGNAPLLLLALLVVGVAVWVSRLAVKAEWLFVRMSANSFVRDLLRQIAQLAIVFCGVVIALQLLDATALLGSLVGALGIIGLALGFATRDTVENYIASLLLSLRQPFRSEDYVSIDGVEGKVLRLTPRATVLMSLAGNHLRIPNARVYKATITNFTRNPLRRFEFAVGVDTDIELNLPRELAVKTVSDIPGVLENPAAQCLVEALGDSSVILRTFAWIDQRETDYLKVRSEAQQRVKEAFDVAGVVMPEPVYNVNLRRRRSAAVRPGPAPAPQTAPAPEESGNTARDSTVEDQMRKEQRQSNEEDLLSGSAPTE
jgi:small-conductance mechanosensitive channel